MDWILSIIGGSFLLFQVGIVVAVVVSGLACIIYGIWKLVVYLADKKDQNL